MPDIVEANEEIMITAHSDREDVLLYVSVVEPTTGEVVAAAPMHPREPGDYAARVRAPVGLWRVDVAAVKELPQVTVSDLVLCVGGA